MSEEKKLVLYHNKKVLHWWPKHMEDCQRISSYSIEGKSVARIRYGDERRDLGAKWRPCYDCAALVGQYHSIICDAEQCPVCGGKTLDCKCEYDEE